MAEGACDVVVIGGGIAGVSVAAHLSAHVRVLLLEMEDRLSYHSTGRSAALFSQTYGNDSIRALAVASRSFFFDPPQGFCTSPLVRPRSVLTIVPPAQAHELERLAQSLAASGDIERLTPAQALRRCPVLRPEALCGALLDRSSADIEVHELHQGYLRWLRARGGSVTTRAEVTSLQRQRGVWHIRTPDTLLSAPIVVNAAGAWAGALGRSAGATDIRLQPLRRTAALIDPPAGLNVESWPMVLDVDETFYLKPEAGMLLLSPADETPAAPGDAQPEEWDIAMAVERVQRVTTLEVPAIRRKWAGLRSFVADRSPVVGYDPIQPGFFWLAALGGYGLQTAPALSQLAAGLILRQRAGADAQALDPAILAPSRAGRF